MSTQDLANSLFGNDPLTSRYEIEQQLASKAGRLTLLARDRSSGELVVVKILSFGSDFEWDALKLFEREAQTLKTLSHPAIPRYLDFFELSANSKGFALVQSYVAGKSLEEYLKAGRTFSQAEVKQLALSLLEILIYLHGRKPPVIHRDIKPSNILLGDRTGNSIGQVYLVDFGSVQTLAAKEGGTMTIVGTYGYMPPEQFGDRTVPASDLYSLGATLIYLVTGTHPADLPHKDGKIQFQPELLSPAFAHWLRWMSEPSLDRRLASAQDALQALEHPEKDFAPLVVSQPFGSKIRLTKDANSLEILMPRKGFSGEIASLIVFAIAWNSFILVWTSTAVLSAPMGFNIFFALFSLPFWSAGIGMVWRILSNLFGTVRLCLNQQQISFTYEIFVFKFNQSHPAPIQKINQLELEYFDGAIYRIIIWAGTHSYELGRNNQITQAELDWLSYELSEWLRLPITTKHLPGSV